jgi:hypothetical protein
VAAVKRVVVCIRRCHVAVVAKIGARPQGVR